MACEVRERRRAHALRVARLTLKRLSKAAAAAGRARLARLRAARTALHDSQRPAVVLRKKYPRPGLETRSGKRPAGPMPSPLLAEEPGGRPGAPYRTRREHLRVNHAIYIKHVIILERGPTHLPPVVFFAIAADTVVPVLSPPPPGTKRTSTSTRLAPRSSCSRARSKPR